VQQLFEVPHLPRFFLLSVDMVKRGSSSFSAASVAKGSVVLSRAVEKSFALEAEISRLRHHVSVLSRRLHLVCKERDELEELVYQLQVQDELLFPQEVAGSDEIVVVVAASLVVAEDDDVVTVVAASLVVVAEDVAVAV